MLVLHSHPLASFCHKVLIPLYENATPFTHKLIDLQSPEESARFKALWPVGKMPLLVDDVRDRVVPETTIIIEYLDAHYAGRQPMLPHDDVQRLDVRLWDRFYDNYVQAPMQKIVADRLRAEDVRDPTGVAEARATLQLAYGMVDAQLAKTAWAATDEFTLADCAASPALFYASCVEPFGPAHGRVAAFLARLMERPSFHRVLDEAAPYWKFFPYKEALPEPYRAIAFAER
jgi:glutathione S-transferase